MLNFKFLQKGLRLVSPPHFLYDFSKKLFSFYILPTDQVALSHCLNFSRYWSIYVLELFANKIVKSKILRLTLSF